MKPAARMSDPTAHGGAIVQGASMVLIDGLPAAAQGDMTVCPLAPPAAPPPPHVGGPIVSGNPMVLIEGKPAARMGDVTLCAGGVPAVIVSGSANVLVE